MGDGDRRRLIVLLGVLGLLVAGFVGFSVFGGGDGGGDAAGGRVASRSAGGGRERARGGAAPEQRLLGPSDTFDIYATKNPFEPVVGPVSPTVPPTFGPTTSSPGTTATTSGSQTTVTAIEPGTTTTTAGTFEPTTGEAVALLDVFEEGGVERARVRVGSTVYTVGEGDTFATSYRVVALDDPCGDFLFGDAPFSLCEGEEVIK